MPPRYALSLDSNFLSVPAPEIGPGWTQEIKRDKENKLRRAYLPPEGKKLTTENEIQNYLNGNKGIDQYTVSVVKTDQSRRTEITYRCPKCKQEFYYSDRSRSGGFTHHLRHCNGTASSSCDPVKTSQKETAPSTALVATEPSVAFTMPPRYTLPADVNFLSIPAPEIGPGWTQDIRRPKTEGQKEIRIYRSFISPEGKSLKTEKHVRDYLNGNRGNAQYVVNVEKPMRATPSPDVALREGLLEDVVGVALSFYDDEYRVRSRTILTVLCSGFAETTLI